MDCQDVEGPIHSWPDHCRRAYYRDATRRYRARHPTRAKESDLRNRYGLSLTDFHDLLEAQGGVCAICSEPEQVKDGRSLAVDHDHSTGEVRGLLCQKCNTGLGKFRDSPDLLREAIKYLEGTR
ncbi:endonuclease VII domain-containing protein [Sphingomonas sp. J344]|uniref:endonuclease VII domain-containing protein n=1 Tax=unclassified Sphingomonas TaxID=196159 RepID=UPI0035B4A662